MPEADEALLYDWMVNFDRVWTEVTRKVGEIHRLTGDLNVLSGDLDKYTSCISELYARYLLMGRPDLAGVVAPVAHIGTFFLHWQENYETDQ